MDIDENNQITWGLDKKKAFLESAIMNYNAMFGTGFNADSAFSDYYKDVSSRVKNKEIDILIVANMFLMGFDAPMLNTTWIDKT